LGFVRETNKIIPQTAAEKSEKLYAITGLFLCHLRI